MSDQTDLLQRLVERGWNGESSTVADELVNPESVIRDREITTERRGPALPTSSEAKEGSL